MVIWLIGMSASGKTTIGRKLYDQLVLSSEKWVLHTKTEQAIQVAKIQTATTLFIGPEGGFTEQELSWMVERNCQCRTLGPLILKSDTAAIVSSSRALF